MSIISCLLAWAGLQSARWPDRTDFGAGDRGMDAAKSCLFHVCTKNFAPGTEYSFTGYGH